MDIIVCDICIGKINDKKKLMTHFCLCKFNCHIKCFYKYYFFNNEMKCPICKERDYYSILKKAYNEYNSYYRNIYNVKEIFTELNKHNKNKIL